MNKTNQQVKHLCIMCHQPIKKGISKEFEITKDNPILCLKCAEEIACTMTIKYGGFW